MYETQLIMKSTVRFTVKQLIVNHSMQKVNQETTAFKSSCLLSCLHVSVDKQEEKNQGILFCFLFIENSTETLQLKTFLLNNNYTTMDVRLTIIYDIIISTLLLQTVIQKQKNNKTTSHIY